MQPDTDEKKEPTNKDNARIKQWQTEGRNRGKLLKEGIKKRREYTMTEKGRRRRKKGTYCEPKEDLSTEDL